MTRAWLIGLVLPGVLLAGCTTTREGVLAVKRLDHNQYEISRHVIGSLDGMAEVRTEDDRTATAYCADKGQAMGVVERHGYGGVAAQDILVFRCSGPPGTKTAAAPVTASK